MNILRFQNTYLLLTQLGGMIKKSNFLLLLMKFMSQLWRCKKEKKEKRKRSHFIKLSGRLMICKKSDTTKSFKKLT